MAYQAGDRLGSYEIRRKIGSGGMGEVYEARDIRLERSVAIKVLPTESMGLSHSARRERLEREARAISKLNHPNLCSLYDVGEQDGAYYLVLELIDGTTLQDELSRRSIPLKEALRIGAEIADGLAAAHRLGVVHRDLKPGNIMLTRTGAKILDFGLARFTAPDSGEEAHDLESSPTVSRVLTAEGTAVGTPSYMAPEQVTGDSVDARTDLFAFGIVLYEMVAGKPPFRGDRPAAVAAAILKQEPASLREVAPDCPPVVEHLVTSCLMKDPEDRRQSAADLAQDLRYASMAATGATELTSHPTRQAPWLVAAVAVALALAAILIRRDDTPPVERLSVPAPPGTTFTGFSPALSPDGRKLAFIAKDATGDALWLHDLTTAEDVRLVDTGNYFAMFTEDGQELVWGEGNVNVVKSFLLRDGVERVLFDGGWGPRGLAQSANGSLLLAPDNRSPLYVWREGDDEPRVVTTIDREGGEVSHRHPQFLPDGEHFVFLVVTRDPRDSVAYVGSLSEGKLRKLVDTLCPPLFADGHLFFVQDQTLWAQTFDVRSLELRGTAVPIVPSLGAPAGFPINLAISDSGVLAYGPDVFTVPPSRLLWYDRAGNELSELGEGGSYQGISLSPDGERVAATVPGDIAQDIGIVDARGVFTRVAGSPLNERGAVWSPTGDSLLFGSDRDGGGTQLYVQDLTSGEAPRLLLGEERDEHPDASDWDSQGRIWFTLRSDDLSRDIWFWRDGEAEPFLTTRHNELTPRVSPDGAWLAFVSNESGRPEVYLQPLEQAGETRRVSHDGGRQPRWRADGRELYYLSRRGEIMATSTESAYAARETAQVLFRPPIEPSIGINGGTFAPSPDGQRFLIVEKPDDPPPYSYTVIFNWRRALDGTPEN